jgi:hypothetical protein
MIPATVHSLSFKVPLVGGNVSAFGQFFGLEPEGRLATAGQPGARGFCCAATALINTVNVVHFIVINHLICRAFNLTARAS